VVIQAGPKYLKWRCFVIVPVHAKLRRRRALGREVLERRSFAFEQELQLITGPVQNI
jgi:hypothetical protein